MRERLIALRERRAVLLGRAAVEREQLGVMLEHTDVATGWFATAAHLVAQAKQHPLWIAAGVAFLVALRPRRMLGWLIKGWTIFRVYRRGRALLDRLAPGLVSALRATWSREHVST